MKVQKPNFWTILAPFCQNCVQYNFPKNLSPPIFPISRHPISEQIRWKRRTEGWTDGKTKKDRKTETDYQTGFDRILKGTLSGPRQFLTNESPLKMMKNAFYFTLKLFFVLKILRFLS